MRRRRQREAHRLGPVETVGAWLRIWTPPREAVVPPVPWNRLLAGALVATALLSGLALLVVPKIETSKRAAAERERKDAAANTAAERRRLREEQRAHYGHARARDGGPPLDPVAERRARRGLLRRIEASITADARRRVAARELKGTVLRTACTPAPSAVRRPGAETTLRGRREWYDCIAVTRDIPRGRLNRAGALGYSFRAVADFRRFRYVWCKVTPVAGERGVPDPRHVVPLPRACALP